MLSKVLLNMFSGSRMPVLDPPQEAIQIEDIAHSLAGSFRWMRMSRERYTTAQHCVEVSRRVPDHLALYGLLHDAAEAYTADLPGPIKPYFMVQIAARVTWPATIVPFAEFEERLLRDILVRFGVAPGPMPEAVHVADRRERARERLSLFGHAWPAEDDRYPAYPDPLVVLGCEAAEVAFLDRFAELKDGD